MHWVGSMTDETIQKKKISKIKDVAIETIQNNHREKRQLLKCTEHH